MSFDARLKAAVERYGEHELASRAAALLVSGEEDDEFLAYVGLGAGDISGFPSYWRRSWGARTLEHYWIDEAAASVILGLDDEHWRVRMICARVCGKREIPLAEKLDQLTRDDYWRVREAAARALSLVGEGEHADALRELLDDENDQVQDAAERALATLSERLDRDFGPLGP